MNNPVRRSAKTAKAIELYTLMSFAQQFAVATGNHMIITLAFGKEQRSVEITPATKIGSELPTWMRAVGEELNVHELKEVHDQCAKQLVGAADVGAHMKKSVLDYNTISQRWQVSALQVRTAEGKAIYQFEVPNSERLVEPEYSSVWKGFERYCIDAPNENRSYVANKLYDAMDQRLLDLKSITSSQLGQGAQFEHLLEIADSLRDLLEEEARLYKANYITQTGHVNAGLAAFASVLREAAHSIGDAPSLMPQRYVYANLAQSLDTGHIPDAGSLRKAWNDGESNAVNLSAFHGNFLGAMNVARKEPEMLFSNIRDTATMANKRELRNLSQNFVQEFQQLRQLTSVLVLRYEMRNDNSAAVRQFVERLSTLQEMLQTATQYGFDPNSTEHKHFFSTMYVQANKTAESYRQIETQRVSMLNETYANYAEMGDEGKMQWLGEMIDEVRDQHPVFSVTHIASIYHRSLLKALSGLGLTGDAPEAETAQQYYIRTTANDLLNYLKTGDIKASEILDTTVEQKMDYFKELPVRFAHADAGHDQLMQHVHVDTPDMHRGDTVMLPEMTQEVPTAKHGNTQPRTLISGDEANEIDSMVKHAQHGGRGRGGSSDTYITRGSSVFGYDD